MKINRFVKSIRFNEEMINLWFELKKYKINPTHLLREGFTEKANQKIKDFKIELTKERLPF